MRSFVLDIAVGLRQISLFVVIGTVALWAMGFDWFVRWDRFETWQLVLVGGILAYVVWAVGFIARRNGGWIV